RSFRVFFVPWTSRRVRAVDEPRDVVRNRAFRDQPATANLDRPDRTGLHESVQMTAADTEALAGCWDGVKLIGGVHLPSNSLPIRQTLIVCRCVDEYARMRMDNASKPDNLVCMTTPWDAELA